MPVRAPRCRMQNDFTGGLLPLAGVGKISALSAARLMPVTGQRWPTGGRRRNSRTAGELVSRGGISTAPGVLLLSVAVITTANTLDAGELAFDARINLN